ncbi:MAG: M20/M25/M40 family metallo-hydrolase [Bdellovibrionales bacterium]|nr:M20/M25/M40 family metallo-hydrolase [Bdellovibrionales bacterium]
MTIEPSKLKAQGEEFVNTQFPELFQLLEKIVLINSHCTNISGVNAVQDIIATELRNCGMQIEFFEKDNQPKALIARSPACAGNNIVLSLHADTVYFPKSKFNWFKDEGDRFVGPGVFDLKGAIVTMLGVIRALKNLNLLEKLPICVLITPDEESDSVVGEAVIDSIKDEINCAIVMELARENDNILIDRYGIGYYDISVTGRADHSGNGFDKGANAFVQLCHTVTRIFALSDVNKYTFNLTNPNSGEQLNVIPDFASCRSDLRLSSISYLPEIDQKIKEIEEDIIIPGTRVSIKRSKLTHPVEATTESLILLDSLLKSAHEAGFSSTRSATSRGASDENIFASHGITTADGLGPSGGKAHIENEEWVDKSSFVPKVLTLVYWFIDRLENPIQFKRS